MNNSTENNKPEKFNPDGRGKVSRQIRHGMSDLDSDPSLLNICKVFRNQLKKK